MKYFTSDLHLGDPRLNLYGRDLIANDSNEINELIINNWNEIIQEDDIVYMLGDICYDANVIDKLNHLKGYKILIKGNYDDKIQPSILNKYFDEIHDELLITLETENIYLNHYPTNAKLNIFNIVGHIHGTWKVQRNMINVGVDAWHFKPVSEEMILWQINGIRKYYDENVFAGELWSNLFYANDEIKTNLLNQIKNENDN